MVSRSCTISCSGELFVVQRHQLGAVFGTEPLEPPESEPYQTVLAGDDEVRHLPRLDAVHQRHEPRSLEIRLRRPEGIYTL